MRNLFIAPLTLLMLGVTATFSQAAFLIHVRQTGANVTMSYSGSFTFVGTGTAAPHIPNNWVQKNEFYRITDIPNSTEHQFNGTRTPDLNLFPNWTAPARLFADSATGSKIALIDDGRVVTSEFGLAGWSGQTYSAAGTLVFNNRFVSDFINNNTTLTFQWTQQGQAFNPSNTITVTSVPEPTSAACFGTLALALTAVVRRRFAKA